MSEEIKPVLEYQQTEIDQCRDDLRDARRFLRRFVESDTIRRNNSEVYLRGVHDGLSWGVREVESITQYDNYDRQYDVRLLDDEPLTEALKVVISEAHNENWGNVAVNLENAAEKVRSRQSNTAEGDD